jgi:hypothetical protein
MLPLGSSPNHCTRRWDQSVAHGLLMHDGCDVTHCHLSLLLIFAGADYLKRRQIPTLTIGEEICTYHVLHG